MTTCYLTIVVDLILSFNCSINVLQNHCSMLLNHLTCQHQTDSQREKASIPRNSLAHQMVRLNGWSREDAIYEIAGFDGVDENEAERRFDAARKQLINRIVGQSRRWNKAKMAIEDARFVALGIAYHKGQFLCAEIFFRSISGKAGWGYSIGYNSNDTMRYNHRTAGKEGLFSQLYDGDKFVRYVLTGLGRLKFTD